MRNCITFGLLILSTAISAGLSTAQGSTARKPGSMLIFMGHRSGPNNVTILNITNTSGTHDVNAHIEYVNVTNNPNDPFCPLGCTIFNRHEYLTANDTLSVLTRCHNVTTPQAPMGYVVVTAQDPAQSNVDICFDHLMGTQFIFNMSGMFLILNAQPIQCAAGDLGTPTDVNQNQKQEFNGVEYLGLPDQVMVESFIAAPRSRLCMINLTGECTDTNHLYLSIYNDNELALSTTRPFKVWFDQPLEVVSPLFSSSFMASLPNDPEELDLFCDGSGDLETGWAKIESIGVQIPGGQWITNDGVVIGCIASGVGGDPVLFESKEVQYNGLFLGRPTNND